MSASLLSLAILDTFITSQGGISIVATMNSSISTTTNGDSTKMTTVTNTEGKSEDASSLSLSTLCRQMWTQVLSQLTKRRSEQSQTSGDERRVTNSGDPKDHDSHDGIAEKANKPVKNQADQEIDHWLPLLQVALKRLNRVS